ncbi:MAG: LAGLIDADG family homing endonuclease, partial [Nanoarchaeota archaeon]|nr:LAGLIDADG family homing endonuclease [Nanoarchaeota archaeon]
MIITPEIAKIAGLFAADGSMQKNHICFWGNITEDKDFYDNILKPLFFKAFDININPHIKISNSVYGFYICNRKVINFFNNDLSFPFGSKTYSVEVPEIILKSKDPIIWQNFISGYLAGDGCLNFDKIYGPGYQEIRQIIHTYPRIQLTSVSPQLISGSSVMLNKLGIKHFIYKIKKNKSNEKDAFRLQVSGVERLEEWYKQI